MRSPSWFGVLILVSLAGLLSAQPVFALPPLPSSFHGIVTVNGAPVPDGTLIEVSVAGQVFAQNQTQTYEGNSVYILNVPGDDSSTPGQREGGREGEVVQFMIDHQPAVQVGAWHGGTSVVLDLAQTTFQAALPLLLRSQ
jgi:hypothetical protein